MATICNNHCPDVLWHSIHNAYNLAIVDISPLFPYGPAHLRNCSRTGDTTKDALLEPAPYILNRVQVR